MLVELGPLMRDTTVKFYPAVFLANAIAAFILNLVRAPLCHCGLVYLSYCLRHIRSNQMWSGCEHNGRPS